jgi:hypothetical protein
MLSRLEDDKLYDEGSRDTRRWWWWWWWWWCSSLRRMVNLPDTLAMMSSMRRSCNRRSNAAGGKQVQADVNTKQYREGAITNASLTSSFSPPSQPLPTGVAKSSLTLLVVPRTRANCHSSPLSHQQASASHQQEDDAFIRVPKSIWIITSSAGAIPIKNTCCW